MELAQGREADEALHVQEILLAASCHDLKTLQSLVETYRFPDCRAVDVQDPETKFTPLHAAIAACETEDDHDPAEPTTASSNGMAPEEDVVGPAKETTEFLLQNGAIWNQLDSNDETPGCIANRLGLKDLYHLMVDAGVRAELLLNRLEGYEVLEDEDGADETREAEGNARPDPEAATEDLGTDASQDAGGHSTKFLSSVLSHTGDKLLDDQQNGVMMAWEAGIMSKSANAILHSPGLTVLNVGFGMGIIDTYIQEHPNTPASHHIVEAHPEVLADMKSKGWYGKPGVVIHEGKWQDVLPSLVAAGLQFDAIYFDTFAESYSQFREFFSEQVIGLLAEDGKWSFFNGMGADRQIVYDVYQKVVEMDLFEAGFDIDWEEIEIPELQQVWEGVKRKYWNVNRYRLPICRYME